MKIFINDTECNLPFTMSEVTLGQYRDFQKKYGKEIEANPAIEGLAWFQHFTGFDFINADDAIKKQVIDQWNIFSPVLKDESDLPQCTDHFFWNNDTWSFQTFTEEELVPEEHWYNYKNAEYAGRMMPLFKINPWFYLPHLCSVFFRKQNEELREYVVSDISERFQWMLQLPLHMAMAIKNHLLAAIDQPITS